MAQALQSLQAAKGQPRFLVATDSTIRLGIGITARIESPDLAQAATAAAAHPGVSLFGGFAFDARHEAKDPWGAFPACLFVVAAVERVWRDGAWHEQRNGQAAPTARSHPPSRAHPPPALDTQDSARSRWNDQVAQALDEIRKGRVDKVVLSRVEALPPVDSLAAFRRLAALEPGADLFYFEPTPGHAFFGATPERLVELKQGFLRTHAVAGTARRMAEAAGEGKRLLAAGKEGHEHELVAAHILGALSGLGIQAEREPRGLRRMANVQHLETRIRAEGVNDHVLHVAQGLHPTPATCGAPVQAARQLIDDLEDAQRGWYTGGIGWFTPDGEGTVLVALRCALSTPEGTWIHAGAGIVEGSDAQKEWEETEAKLQAVREAVA
jgi:menaquinone-specific isochorismate synthase